MKKEKNDKKYVLIVGAGLGQIPVIKAAKKLGYKVVTVDRNPDAPGMKIADYSHKVDITDSGGVLKIAKKYNISGILTFQSDFGVPTVGYVCDQMNLCGISKEVADWCSNKAETRLRFQSKKIPQPDFGIVKSLDEAKKTVKKIGFPCVVKAPDSAGSRGVTKVKKIEEIEAAFKESKKYARDSKILIEEYIEGIEFGAQTFSQNNKCEKVILHNDAMTPPPYMVPIGHSLPFENTTSCSTEEIQDAIKRAVEALGIGEGPANIDTILRTKDGTVKLIEIGARAGATCLPELVTYSTGIDWPEVTVRKALGEEVDLEFQKYEPISTYILQAYKDGIIKSFDIPKFIKEDPDVLELECEVEMGSKVNKFRKGTDRIGRIVVRGKTLQEAERKAIKYQKKIKIVVK